MCDKIQSMRLQNVQKVYNHVVALYVRDALSCTKMSALCIFL